ncbi:MAG: hypothetical protein GF313_16445 [Caldithrix sp.]|nr:hypothetical protein [Caldithrix sp.]
MLRIAGKSFLFFVMVLTVFFNNAVSQSANNQKTDQSNPLAPFERLIGGQWYMQDSYQTFSWGVGKLSVLSESYVVEQGQARKVSEGYWFYHPGQGQIKGYFTAIDMPVQFFDYTTVFKSDTMKNDLISYSAGGQASHYLETWTFSEDGRYQWTLFTKTDNGRQKIMGGTYQRRNLPGQSP